MDKDEPPSQCSECATPMLVGRNSRGQWVVRSEDGLYGGLFVNRTEAVRYALFENGHRADAVIMVGGVLELSLDDHVDNRAAGAIRGRFSALADDEDRQRTAA